MKTLRDYQSAGERQIREAFAAGKRAPLYVLPTGGGKTTIFSSVAHSAERRSKRVLILAHRVELVDQIVESLKDFDVRPDVIAAGYNRSRNFDRASNRHIAVASVQTMIRRTKDYPSPTLVICDEAHHCVGGTSWSEIMRAYPEAKRLGVTATPIRLDGRGLASHFDHLIVGPSVRELMDLGYLSRARIFAPPTVDTSGLHKRAGDFKQEEAEQLMDVPSITGDALSHYRQHADGLQALAFCTSVQHAHNVAEQFRRDGIPALALDGETDKDLRRMAVADFRAGSIKVLASCDLFSEGFDVPGTVVGIMLRPTASETLFRQQIGRCLRIAPGKTHAIILDHVGNTQRFGLPDEPREWSLAEDSGRKKKKPAPSVRVCEKCFAASPARVLTCAECGNVFEVKARQEIMTKDGKLVELTAEMVQKKQERQAQGMSKGLMDLIAFGKRKGYSEGWAMHVWQAREAKKAAKKKVKHDTDGTTLPGADSDALPLPAAMDG